MLKLLIEKQVNMRRIKELLDFTKRKSIIYYAMLCMILLSAIVCIFTYTQGINDYDTWDFNEGVFWAEATIKARSIINPNYTYYYFLPFGSNILMIPFVMMFGTTYFANQMGMLVFLLIYSLTIFRLSKILYQDTKKSVLFCVITSMFVYTYIGDNLFHHLLNYGIGFVCFLGELGCLLDICKNNNTKKSNYILLIIYCLWSSLNGLASIVFSSASVILSFLISYIRFEKSITKEETKVLLTILITNICGYVINKMLEFTSGSHHQQNIRFIFSDLRSIIENINKNIFEAVFTIFYFVPNGENFFSFEGIFDFIKLAFLVLLLIVSFYYIVSEYSKLDFYDFFFLMCNVVLMLICYTQFILSRESVQRFLFNGLLSMFVLSGLWFCIDKKSSKNVLYTGILFFLLSALTMKQVLITYPAGQKNKHHMEEMIEVLTNNNLSFGYTFSPSKYWKQANLLSNGDLNSLPIGFIKETQKFYINVDSRRYYIEELEKPKVPQYYIFVHQKFIDDEEVYIFLANTVSDAEKEIVTSDGIIYIFKIDKWDNMFQLREE